MEKIVRDRARIEALRRACDMEPESSGRRALFSRGHRLNMARLGPQMSESHDPSLEPYGEFAKRSALEFWFQSVMLYHGVYMFVFPHNTLGRYPTAISGELFTTDLYRSQINYALYQIFVHVPCLVAELQHNSECLARLLGCGKDMGYW